MNTTSSKTNPSKTSQLRQSKPGIVTVVTSFFLSHWHYFTATIECSFITQITLFYVSGHTMIIVALAMISFAYLQSQRWNRT